MKNAVMHERYYISDSFHIFGTTGRRPCSRTAPCYLSGYFSCPTGAFGHAVIGRTYVAIVLVVEKGNKIS
jgi:hypothetical protein